ncbi:hypothetical protein O6H91_04G048600 [Diphasiastrum complanatum]|uniref:Uncharacterized protein n=2 Tax=Diphasiastrum complanatum TaxID=34168 RepID=A0ACC2DWM3_DIPCM|nr:hypothetical protein O6H91_04G048600 [Diphasiastrum complanatum]KAJ7558622.1 hypothetical protein O6H91_04G048600 [Diphasiastrum complanatum]
MQPSASPASSSSCSTLITSFSSDGSDEPPTPTTPTTPVPIPPIATAPISSSAFRHGSGFSFELLHQKQRSKARPPKGIKRQPLSQKSPNRSPKIKAGKICNCMAGVSGDCAAICCCPLVLLHLLALVLFKLPAAAARKLIAGIKKRLGKKNKCSDIDAEEGMQPSNLSPSWIECFREDMVDQPSVELQDEKFLREYFECKQMGFGGLG